MSEPLERTVEGKTFDQWVAEAEQYTTPNKARELACVMFGLEPDLLDVTESQPDTEQSASE